VGWRPPNHTKGKEGREGQGKGRVTRTTGTRVCDDTDSSAPRGSTISQGSLYRCSATKQRTELRTSHRGFNKTSELGLESDDGWASERGALAARLTSACLLVFTFLTRRFRTASTSEAERANLLAPEWRGPSVANLFYYLSLAFALVIWPYSYWVESLYI